MALTTQISLFLNFMFSETAGGVEGHFNPLFGGQIDRASGDGLDEADEIWWRKPQTLAAASTLNIDLSGTSFVTGFQSSIAFTKIKGIYLKNLSLVVGDTIQIGGGSNPFLLFDDATDVHTIGPGGTFFIEEPSLAGKPVTAATGDIFKIAVPGANAIDFNIAIWGVKA